MVIVECEDKTMKTLAERLGPPEIDESDIRPIDIITGEYSDDDQEIIEEIQRYRKAHAAEKLLLTADAPFYEFIGGQASKADLDELRRAIYGRDYQAFGEKLMTLAFEYANDCVKYDW